jgi:hypothetical protein
VVRPSGGLAYLLLVDWCRPTGNKTQGVHVRHAVAHVARQRRVRDAVAAMDGWMDGWAGGWMDGWMDGRMGGRMDG